MERKGTNLEIKTVIMGPNAEHDKEITLLNRRSAWTSKGITWEADPRHAEAIIEGLGLKGATGVATPATDEIKGLGEARKSSATMNPEELTEYRSPRPRLGLSVS